MAIIRKRNTLDSIDREILKCLIRDKLMVNRQIAKCVGRSPSAIAPRLHNLKTQGIIKPVKISGMRTFNRTFNNKSVKIQAPRSIHWGLDLKKPRRR